MRKLLFTTFEQNNYFENNDLNLIVTLLNNTWKWLHVLHFGKIRPNAKGFSYFTFVKMLFGILTAELVYFIFGVRTSGFCHRANIQINCI